MQPAVGVDQLNNVSKETVQDQTHQTNATVLLGSGDNPLVQTVPLSPIARLACTWTKIAPGALPITHALNGELSWDVVQSILVLVMSMELAVNAC